MDLPTLPIGLALLAIAGAAAGLVAWRRRPRGGLEAHSPRPAPAPAATALAGSAAATPAATPAATTSEDAATDTAPEAALSAPADERAAAPGPASVAAPAFEGPAWETTEPMRGIAIELPFADTMPADTMPADMDFAATNFAATNFAATNFADTLSTDLAVEERPSDARARPGRAPATLPAP